MRSGTLQDALRVRGLVLSFLGLTMIAAAGAVMSPAFPSIMKEFSIPLGLLGILASVWNIGYLFTAVGGSISDRYGEPVVLSISFLLITGAMGLAYVAPSFPVLLALFLVAGVGSAFGEASMNSLVSRLYPKRVGFALNTLHISFSIGAFLGPALAGYLIGAYGSWRLPYLVACIAFAPLAGIATTLAAKFKRSLLANAPETNDNGEETTLLGVISQGRLLMLIGFFYLSSEVGISAWLPSFLILERGFSVEWGGLSVGLFWALMALGRLVLGSLTDKHGYKWLLVSCSFLSALVILAATLVKDPYVMVALWSLAGFIFGPIMPTIFAWCSVLFPSRRGFATGIVYGVGFLGAISSPWLLGVVAESHGLGVSAFYLAFSAAAIGVSVLLLSGNVRRASTVAKSSSPANG